MSLADYQDRRLDAAAHGGQGDVGDYLALLKPRVMSLVVFTGFVGLAIAPGDILAGAEEAMREAPFDDVEGEGELRGPEGIPPPLSEVERVHIFRVLEFTGGNKTRSAKILGITPATLYNKLKIYRSKGLDPTQEKD